MAQQWVERMAVCAWMVDLLGVAMAVARGASLVAKMASQQVFSWATGYVEMLALWTETILAVVKAGKKAAARVEARAGCWGVRWGKKLADWLECFWAAMSGWRWAASLDAMMVASMDAMTAVLSVGEKASLMDFEKVVEKEWTEVVTMVGPKVARQAAEMAVTRAVEKVGSRGH